MIERLITADEYKADELGGKRTRRPNRLEGQPGRTRQLECGPEEAVYGTSHLKAVRGTGVAPAWTSHCRAARRRGASVARATFFAFGGARRREAMGQLAISPPPT